ncbi:MAG: ATPase, T2SS/T4P/T4SS family [Nitrospirota bacterium]|nr:ATPase, T2SS/T4P/T4SS family [Nitrospirota bacterium]
MKFLELSAGRQIEVISEPDGDLPAPQSLSEALAGMEDGRLIVLKRFRGNKEVDSYVERFSEYLETSGRGGCKKVSWVPEPVFREFVSKLRDDSAPVPMFDSSPDPIAPEKENESGGLREEGFPELGPIAIPESLSEKVVPMPDGRIFAHEDLRGRPEFDRFVRHYSMGMDERGKIRDFRVDYVPDRTLRDLLSKSRGESPEEDYRIVLADMGLSSLNGEAEEESPFPSESSRKDQLEKSPGGKRADKAPVRKEPAPEGGSGSLAVDAGKALPEEKEGVPASREGVPECLSTPSGGTIPDFRAPDDIASMVLLFLDGRFYVSREHKTSQHVNYYCRHFVPELWPKIFGDKPLPKPQYVPYETLRKIRMDSLPEETIAAGYRAEGDEARKIMEIIRDAIARRASDIHLRVERDRTQVIFRIHGWLQPVQTLTHDEGERLSRIIYNTMLDSAGRDNMFSDKKPQDGQFRQDYLPRGVSNIREAHVPTGGTGLGTITMVLRLQYGSGQAGASSPEIELLGYREDQLAQLRFLVGLSSGIVIFSGPMGSGKTTSIAAMLYLVQVMNPLERGRGKHIVTMEDPVEYEIPGATQIAVPGGRFVEYSGRTMRLDANFLGIGEVREKDIALAMIADAMSGHMVYTTVHSKDVLTIPRRLDGMEVRRDLLTDPSLFRGLVSQRLVSLLCPDCKLPWEEAEKAVILSPPLKKRLENVSLNPDEVYFHRTGGCESCGNQGIVGRTVVAEILLPDEEILNLIVGGRMMEANRYYSDKLSGRTMMDHAIEKIRMGSVDPLHVESELEWLHNGSLDGKTRLEIIGGLS